MKRFIESILIVALVGILPACGKKDEGRAAFQSQATRLLGSITGKLSKGKAVRKGKRGIAQIDPGQGWYSNNNTYMYSQIEMELQECREFRNLITPTRQNFKALITLSYQCAMQVLQYRNGMQTALYRNLGNDMYAQPMQQQQQGYPQGYPASFSGLQQMQQMPVTAPQAASQFGWSWRYPYQYPDYQQAAPGYQQFQAPYGNSGYIPTTVQYSGTPYQY